MAKQKIISIIIPSWNTQELLKDCLQSCFSFNPQPYQLEVVVVDNGSTDGSPAMVQKEFINKGKKVVLIKNKTNVGYGRANNQGMKKTKGDFLLLLNSDTIIKNQAPVKMARFLEGKPTAGAVGCRLLNTDGTDQPSFGPFPNLSVVLIMLFFDHWFGGLTLKTGRQTQAVDWVMGAALMVKKGVLAKAGLMDEKIFMYMDETEWCYRIRKVGWQVWFYPEAQIVHLKGASSTSGRRDPILNIYRGLIYFYQKHYRSWQLPVLRLMLKLKAGSALFLGWLTNNQYLKETYGQALSIAKE